MVSCKGAERGCLPSVAAERRRSVRKMIIGAFHSLPRRHDKGDNFKVQCPGREVLPGIERCTASRSDISRMS